MESTRGSITGGFSLFDGREASKVMHDAEMLDLRLPSAAARTGRIDAKHAACAVVPVSLGSCVVLGVRRLAEIGNPVVGAHFVDVVDFVRWPAT